MASRHSVAAFLLRFRDDERGATAIEYGLIVALIVLAIITGLTSFADQTTGLYDRIGEAVAST